MKQFNSETVTAMRTVLEEVCSHEVGPAKGVSVSKLVRFEAVAGDWGIADSVD